MKRTVSKSNGQATLFFRSVGKLRKLSARQQGQLATLAREGDKRASIELIKANLPHVTQIAQDYIGMGMSLLDLIAEGNRGLLHAAGRFDAGSNKNFVAHSVWWIRHAMRSALSNRNALAHRETRASAQMLRLQRTEFEMAQTLGRQPTNAELASYLQIPIERVIQVRTTGFASPPRGNAISVGALGPNAVVSSAVAALQEHAGSTTRQESRVNAGDRRPSKAALRLARQLHVVS